MDREVVPSLSLLLLGLATRMSSACGEHSECRLRQQNVGCSALSGTPVTSESSQPSCPDSLGSPFPLPWPGKGASILSSLLKVALKKEGTGGFPQGPLLTPNQHPRFDSWCLEPGPSGGTLQPVWEALFGDLLDSSHLLIPKSRFDGLRSQPKTSPGLQDLLSLASVFLGE